MTIAVCSKTCLKCKESLDFSAFQPRKTSRDGLQNWCRVCTRDYMAAYYKNNKVRMNAGMREWYKDNKDRCAETNRRWVECNRARSNGIKKKYYWTHREKELVRSQEKHKRRRTEEREYQKLYNIENPDVRKGIKQRYREKRGSWLYPRDVVAAVLARDGRSCVYCGATSKLGFDHRLPVSRGGKDTVSNLVVACGPCNSSKGARTPAEWRSRKGVGCQ